MFYINPNPLSIEFKKEEDLIADLLLTVACLTVRNELCLVVDKAGGLQFALDVMVDIVAVMREVWFFMNIESAG